MDVATHRQQPSPLPAPTFSVRLPWLDNLREQMVSQGQAGFLSLVVETILFWLMFLLPAAAFLYHEQVGTWVPSYSDPEEWTTFTSILGTCYVFCKMPPIEAARWAWVFAMTPWIAENVVGDTRARANGNCTNSHLYKNLA